MKILLTGILAVLSTVPVISKTLTLNCSQEDILLYSDLSEPAIQYKSSVTMIIQDDTVLTKSKSDFLGDIADSEVMESVYKILQRDLNYIQFKDETNHKEGGVEYLDIINLNLNNKTYLGVSFVGVIAGIARGKCF